MRILDKYLLRTLLTPLLYCVVGFSMMVVIFDLFENFSDFVEAQTAILSILRFYAILLPSYLIYIMPISLLLAVLYALWQLSKSHELVAMRASGISLLRLMAPYLAVGLLASAGLSLVHETIGPWGAYWTRQFLDMQDQTDASSLHKTFNLAFKNDRDLRVWMIGAFDTRTFEMQNINVTQLRPDGSDEFKVQARRARWLDKRWWFEDLYTQTYRPDGSPMGTPVLEMNREMGAFKETPRDFINEIKDPQYLSSLEILNFIRTHQGISHEARKRMLVDLHSRLAMPWTCLVVVLIGVPFGAQTGRKGAFMGIALALASFFAYYVLINLGLALGKKQYLEPWLAGWLPNIFFLVLGMLLLRRMR